MEAVIKRGDHEMNVSSMNGVRELRRMIDLCLELDDEMPIYRAALILDLLQETKVDRCSIEERLGLSQAAVVRNLQALDCGTKGVKKEGLGIIELVTDENDKRAKKIRLTAKGEVLRERFFSDSE